MPYLKSSQPLKAAIFPFSILLLFTVFLSSFPSIAQSQEYHKIRFEISAETLPLLLSNGVDHLAKVEENVGEAVVSDFDLAEIKKLGLKVEVVQPNLQSFYVKEMEKSSTSIQARTSNLGCTLSAIDSVKTPENFALGSMGGFLTYLELLDHLDNMVEKFPHLITVKQPIGDFQTYEGRPIHYVKISDNPNTDEEETGVLYTALHHAREPASLSQLIFFMYYLLENYESNQIVKQIVDRNELYFVPCVNPDGYHYNATSAPNGGGMWRKNRKDNGNGTIGVDLNRNYAYEWGGVGSSGSGSSDIYRGPEPFSEPETQAIRYFTTQHQFINATNSHTAGEWLLFPFGYTENAPTPDHAFYTNMTTVMVDVNDYKNSLSSGLYPAAGDSDDWMYGDQETKNKILAMTPEIGEDFWFPANQIENLCKKMLWQNLSQALQANSFMWLLDTDDELVTLNETENSFQFYAKFKPIGRFIPEEVKLELSTSNPDVTILQPELTINSLFAYSNKFAPFEVTLAEGVTELPDLTFQLKISYDGQENSYEVRKKVFRGLDQWKDYETDFNELANWETTGNWGLTSAVFYSPGNSLADSPNGNYLSNTNSYAQSPLIDLTQAQYADLTFKAFWELQELADFVSVLVVAEDGSESVLCSPRMREANGTIGYSGNSEVWLSESFDLSAFLGNKIYIRFQLQSDGSGNAQGIFVDDLQVNVVGKASAPLLVDQYPLHESVDVEATVVPTLTFDQDISLAAEGISLQFEAGIFPASVEISGNQLQIIPDDFLAFNTTYTVVISPDALLGSNQLPFTGLAAGNWSFITRSAPPEVQIVELYPENGATDVLTLNSETYLTIEFDQKVVVANREELVLREKESQEIIPFNMIDDAGFGTVFIIQATQDLKYETTYQFLIAENAVRGENGSFFSGIAEGEWEFTTEPEPQPLSVVQLSPENGTTNVPLDSPIVVTFDQDIFSDSPEAKIFTSDVGSQETLGTEIATGAQISEKTLLIWPEEGLQADKVYRIQIPSGIFRTQRGLLFSGIVPENWRFSTESEILTGLEENWPSTIQVFPNPVTEVLQVDWINSLEKPKQLTVFAITGEKVVSTELEASSQTASISLTSLQPGLYLISLQTEQHRYFKRVMKN